MKLTYLQINNLYEFINYLINNNICIPMKTGFKLLYNLQELMPLYTEVQKEYNEIIASIDNSEKNKDDLIKEAIKKIENKVLDKEYNPLYFNPKEFDGYRFSFNQIQLFLPLLKVGQNEDI